MRSCLLPFAFSARHFPGCTVRATFCARLKTPCTILAATLFGAPLWVLSTLTVPLSPAMATRMPPCALKQGTQRSAEISRNTTVRRTRRFTPLRATSCPPSLRNTVEQFAPQHSYGYSKPMGHQTSDFRLLWTIPPNPQPPNPPMIDLCPPPQDQTCALPPISDLPPPPPPTPFSLAQFCTLLPCTLQTMTMGMN